MAQNKTYGFFGKKILCSLRDLENGFDESRVCALGKWTARIFFENGSSFYRDSENSAFLSKFSVFIKNVPLFLKKTSSLSRRLQNQVHFRPSCHVEEKTTGFFLKNDSSCYRH